MTTQRDVQQLIQSLTPSAVNNGNPNTVYNQPMPQGGYIPPTYDPGTNTWRINQAPPALGVNWQQMALGQTQPCGGWNIGTPVALNPGGGTTTPLVVSPPTGGGGGGATPVIDPGTRGSTPVPVVGGPAGSTPPVGVPGTLSGDLFRDRFHTNPTHNYWVPGGALNLANPQLGATSGGSTGGTDFNWRNLLDAVVPGNIYHSGTEQWNPWGMAEGLGDLAGVPIRQVLDAASSMYGDDVSNWPALLQDRYMGELANKTANYNKQFQDFMDRVTSETEDKMAEKLDESLADKKLRYNTQEEVDKAKKEAEAEAARAFLESITGPVATMNRLNRQSQEAMKKMFGNKMR